MNLSNSKKRRTVYLISLFSFLISLSSLASDSTNFYFDSGLQVNYSAHFLPVLYSQAKIRQYLYLDQTTIFPGAELIGTFMMLNRSTNIIKLAPEGQFISQYIQLIYSYEDSTSIEKSLPVDNHDAVNVYSDSVGVIWGKKTFLPPKASVKVDGYCHWEALSELHYGFLKINWVFDNRIAAKTDSTITRVYWQSEDYLFKYTWPETRMDSIYYFDQRGFYLNSKEKFEEALEFSQKVLRLDSLDYDALQIAADVLWKMNRFDEALIYAERGKKMLEDAAQTMRDRGGVVRNDDIDPYIEKMTFFITKCQNREKWKWAK
ncbi:MAG: tetratricopeptide repeat protein [bacterium]|nr:tetratricopeptide repeat protein [bacterium]